MVVLQTASAEGYRYLFKKDFPPGEFAAVDAVQEEKSEANLKLTDVDGKLSVWQENLLAAKFPLFDGAKEAPNPEILRASIAALEQFIADFPKSIGYLDGLLDQQKELEGRLKNKTADTSQMTGEALSRYLAEPYNEERTYSIAYLDAKIKRGEAFKLQLPEQVAKISDYMKPWEEALSHGNAGLQRFEGEWMSSELVAKAKADRMASKRQVFLEKELFFSIPQEAIPQSLVYVGVSALGFSFFIILLTLLQSLRNLSNGLTLGTVISLCLGLGGLAAYGYGGWLFFKEPLGYSAGLSPAKTLEASTQGQDKITLEEFLFRNQQSIEDKDLPKPGRYVLQDPDINLFLRKYARIEGSERPDAYAVTRRGFKVQMLVDRILIFDELSWFKKNVVVCYTFYYANSKNGFEFFKTEASVGGGIPLPGKIFKYLWDEAQPAVATVLVRSKVLENYHVTRMESGTIELISNRKPPKAEP